MPRTIQVSLPAEKTPSVLERVRPLEGVVGLSLQQGASLQPAGDILSIQTTNGGTRAVLNELAACDVLGAGGSIQTGELKSLLSSQYRNGLAGESNETIWEEMAFLLRRDTNPGVNYLALMALAGGVAGVGLWTNTAVVVIGAMVIAPGFEPLLRIPFGWIAGPRVLAWRGVASTLLGYLALALGAALTFLLLRALEPAASPDLATRSWVQHWISLQASSALLALLAGAAGAVVVTAQRPVLSAGVMIALVLIPSMAVAGMAAAAGDLALALQGLQRWALDAGAVLLAGAAVLGLKHRLLHRRTSLG